MSGLDDFLADSERALRRSFRRVLFLVAMDLSIIASYLWALMHRMHWWWWYLPLSLWVLVWMLAAVRSHVIWRAEHDRLLLARERWRMEREGGP